MTQARGRCPRDYRMRPIRAPMDSPGTLGFPDGPRLELECTGRIPGPQARTRNRGTASPPPNLLPVHSPGR